MWASWWAPTCPWPDNAVGCWSDGVCWAHPPDFCPHSKAGANRRWRRACLGLALGRKICPAVDAKSGNKNLVSCSQEDSIYLHETGKDRKLTVMKELIAFLLEAQEASRMPSPSLPCSLVSCEC